MDAAVFFNDFHNLVVDRCLVPVFLDRNVIQRSALRTLGSASRYASFM